MLIEATTIGRSVPARTVRLDRHDVAARALRVARRTALGVLGDHALADDVAQEVAITALKRIDALRDPEALEAWVHRIAVRRALKEGRRGSRRRAAELEGHVLHDRTAPPPDDTPTPAAELDGALALLDGLPARQRAALTLRYVHDLDDDAIAAALGCRVGTVRSLLSRGRSALREGEGDAPSTTAVAPVVPARPVDPQGETVPPHPADRSVASDRGAPSRSGRPATRPDTSVPSDSAVPSRPDTTNDHRGPQC